MIRYVIIGEDALGVTGAPLGKFLETEDDWLLNPSTFEMICRLRVVITFPNGQQGSLPIHHRCIVELDIPNAVLR